MQFTRRQSLAALAGAAALLGPAHGVVARPLPGITVSKDPTCRCCGGWVEHLRAAGFAVTVIDAADLKPLKLKLGVPDDLAACHSAVVGRYVLEGHVPAAAILRLLQEAPDATGLAVPGMPAGSPGMGGTPETYEVALFSPSGRRSFGRYRGALPAD